MAPPQTVVHVKLIVAILWTDHEKLVAATRVMSDEWGEVDFTGPDRPFDSTDYYDREMNGRPQRRLISFQTLVPPESLRAVKLRANAIEDSLAEAGARQVNLDAGYLDHAKIVLGSLKFAGQKIHLGDGVYADLVARFRDGRYQPFEWTFPDFRDGRYDPELTTIRTKYRQQLRAVL